jgi:DNA-binding NarL/FixJ family response regulator
MTVDVGRGGGGGGGGAATVDPRDVVHRRGIPDGGALVGLCEPDPLARRVIQSELRAMDEVRDVVELESYEEVLGAVKDVEPDMIVLELEVGQTGPIEPLTDLLTAIPNTPVLVFSVLTANDVEIAALRAGAAGYVEKDAGFVTLLPALRTVLRGEIAVSRRLTMHIITLLRSAPEGGRGMRPVRSQLTNREWEVLDLISAGATTRDIARELVLTEDTIYSHVKNIMRKLGVHSRAEAVRAVSGDQPG